MIGLEGEDAVNLHNEDTTTWMTIDLMIDIRLEIDEDETYSCYDIEVIQAFGETIPRK